TVPAVAFVTFTVRVMLPLLGGLILTVSAEVGGPPEMPLQLVVLVRLKLASVNAVVATSPEVCPVAARLSDAPANWGSTYQVVPMLPWTTPSVSGKIQRPLGSW